MASINLELKGQLYSKSNSRQMIFKNGVPRSIKNHKVQSCVEDYTYQLKSQLRGHKAFEGPIKLSVIVYYQSRRSDLDISLLQDILEQKVDKQYKAVIFEGVYLNDRQVVKIEAEKRIDPLNPRVELVVEELGESARL